jgi:hypothetical protein
MKTQTPAHGIMQTGEYLESKSFRISCNCHSTDHDADMWIEVNRDVDDPRLADVEVSFYVKTWTPVWKGCRQRLTSVYEILFKGVHCQEHHMILDKQSAINFADAIKNTVKELEK